MKTYATAVFLLMGGLAVAQETPKDTVTGKKIELDEVMVSALRVTKESPVTFSNVDKEQLQPRNLGQDIPVLLNYLPSVVSTSDAGAGIGYTSFRVRGSDATRVNVTINGVPYNDAESQGTFWVNMPDFASSTEDLQLQRGVGTSTNGAGAFGASLNVLTDAVAEDSYGSVSASVGSFNTFRTNAKFSTGLMHDRVELMGRLSKIKSDGYIDRASSDLDSYFLQGAYKDDNTLIKAMLFGGHEITYQAWNGVDAQTLEDDRTFNSAGIYTDENGNTQFYDNEVDNYKQNHFQLHWNEDFGAWSTHLALHYTKGSGYFEQYREDEDFADYSMQPITVDGQLVETTDLIRRRWLDNDFYGTVFSATYKATDLELIFGGGYNEYKGDHFGEIIWARYAQDTEIRDRYYDDNSTKNDFNLYAKANYALNKSWRVFGDLQYRRVGYTANGDETGLVDDTFNFFNPKAGVTFDLNRNNNFYFSYGHANREPNRNDYESNTAPKPERLNDFELGWRYVSNTVQMNTNLYYMGYKDQLVLTGELNDVGAPLRENVGDSYRLGLEWDANFLLGETFALRPNLALSINRNQDFVFQRDGQLEDLGNTHIAYSPGVIVGNVFSYTPVEYLQLSLYSKYVGKQYMGNIDSEGSVLDAYSQSDFNVQYTWTFDRVVDNVVFSALVNNIFNQDIVSNGYFYTYDDDWTNPGQIITEEGAGYYPQAGINFLVGATVNF